MGQDMKHQNQGPTVDSKSVESQQLEQFQDKRIRSIFKSSAGRNFKCSRSISHITGSVRVSSYMLSSKFHPICYLLMRMGIGMWDLCETSLMANVVPAEEGLFPSKGNQ